MESSLFNGVLPKSKGIVVNGALLETDHALKARKMPGILITLRDPAHVIRPNVKDPLHDADQFRQQNGRLFENQRRVPGKASWRLASAS